MLLDETMQPEVEETPAEQEQDAPEVDAGTAETDEQQTTEQREAQEKMIPQSELDRIIGERLARERKKREEELASDPYRKFVERQAKEYGMTPDEYLAEVERQEAIAAVEDEAYELGMSPEALLKQREMERKLKEIEEKEAKQKEQQEQEQRQAEVWQEQQKLFTEKFPTIPIEKVMGDKEFIEYAKEFAPNVSLARRYERYLRDKELASLAKEHGLESRSLRSTSSGRETSNPNDYGLTAEQQELAKAAGMTLKQFYDRLPPRNRRK
jgi:hypothetical protein